MPRVTRVEKARKDYPEAGISKGDTYYHWSFRYGGKHRSKDRPRPSQLTQSKLSGAYAAQESIEDLSGETDIDTIRSVVESAISEIQEVAEEYRDSADTIRETFSESPTADECEEKAEALESYAEELEGVTLDEWSDEPDEDDKATWGDETSYAEALEAYQAWVTNIVDELTGASLDV
ncbi:MAG TPA: hypothetical protein VM537_34460 [Anaerolineae bacterium]|nr:hypothetical protein [Anaerolineae bacterium]